MAIGSIYAHFASKEGVYTALIDRALELDKQYCDEELEEVLERAREVIALGVLASARLQQ